MEKLTEGWESQGMSDHHKPEEMTDVQEAFWRGLTDQRVANMWAAADDWADLSPEAKEWLRMADKKKIKQLNDNLEFYSASKTIWKFLWVGGGIVVALLAGWKALGEFITVKFK